MQGRLVLTRKPMETILIGEGESQIKLTVVAVQGKVVKLSFEAPRAIRILREELELAPSAEGYGR